MIYIFTGAGISAESGIRTFRDSDGLWNEYKIEDVCDITTFHKNYNMVHEFYNMRRAELANVQPNEAHYIVDKIKQEYSAKVYTTNVDDLHERAGTKGVIHVHGDITKIVDMYDGSLIDYGYEPYKPRMDEAKRFKPAVVFFGEAAPRYQDIGDDTCDMSKDDVVIFVGMSFNVVDYRACLPYNPDYWPTVINVNPDMKALIPHAKNILQPATTGMAEVYEWLKTNYKS